MKVPAVMASKNEHAILMEGATDTKAPLVLPVLEDARAPVGAADPVPSVTSEVTVPVKKLAPHWDATALCTVELSDIRVGSSCWKILNASWMQPVQVTLDGKLEFLMSVKISVKELNALPKVRLCPSVV